MARTARDTLHGAGLAQPGEGLLTAEASRAVPRRAAAGVTFPESGQSAFKSFMSSASCLLRLANRREVIRVSCNTASSLSWSFLLSSVSRAQERNAAHGSARPVLPTVRVGTDEDSFELVDRLGTGLDRPTLGELVHAGELQRRIARTWPGHAPALSAPPGPCSGHRADPTCRAGDGSVRSARAGSRRSTSWASMQRASAAPMELASDPMAHRVVGTNRTDRSEQ